VRLNPDPSPALRGRTTFERLEGRKFVIERSMLEAGEFPRSASVIGPDHEAGTYCVLY
jgi:hypothetical protein